MTLLRIGLTGGMGCGKSTVAEHFSALNVPIIDADQLAREVVKPDTQAFHAIVKHFGTSILTADKKLNRNALRQRIFSAPEERVWLECYLHPLIRNAMAQRIDSLTAPYCILVIPLLFESGLPHPLVDRILVVDAPKALQIERVKARDSLPEHEIIKILEAQVPPSVRLDKADDIIVNDGDQRHLQQQVQHLHELYLSMC